MGIDSRRPPLPAPTESMDEQSGIDTEVATNLTTRTDKTSYSIPEDGTPITIPKRSGKHHSRQKSQTSLLIEYFESSKSGDKTRSRPSVRVKVTPSGAKKTKAGAHDAIQITGIGHDRKPSYTRRISLGNSQRSAEPALAATEGTELSHSSGSNVSGRPPVEIEVLDNNGSDLSNAKSTRGLMYAQNESNVSSMPPDSLIGGSELSRITDADEEAIGTQKDHLTAPIRTRSRSRSQDRITQKVMEKLGQTSTKPRKSSRSERDHTTQNEYDAEGYPIKPSRRRISRHDEETRTADSSLVSSNLAPSGRSIKSDGSQSSRMTNNPKLLEMVEDTIKRMILPEISALKKDQKTDRNLHTFNNSGRKESLSRDELEQDGLERRVSKSSSTPNISAKPRVVLNRDGDDPGTTLSRGDSEYRKVRKSSRENYNERPSSRRSSGRNSYQGDGYDDTEYVRNNNGRNSHKIRDLAAAGLAGGALTEAALHHHDSKDDVRSQRKRHSKSRSSRSRSGSVTETELRHRRREDIPPMPLASRVNESDVTRESIVSSATEMQHSPELVGTHTPIREVSRGSFGALSPASPTSARTQTPTKSPISRGYDANHDTGSLESGSPISTNARKAALAAAGLGGVALVTGARNRHVDTDGYGSPTSPRGAASPVQSVSSLKKQFEDEESLVPQGLRPRSAASRSSAGQLHHKQGSQQSLRSDGSSPVALNRSRGQSPIITDLNTLGKPDAPFMREGSRTPGSPGTPGTPNNEAIDEWYERQHRINDRYRDSYGERATNRDSYQTNPFPEDDRRLTSFTESSHGYADSPGADKDIKPIGSQPRYVYESFGAESNVASLMDPSMLSSSLVSGQGSPDKGSKTGTYANRMADHIRDMDKAPPAMYNGSTLSQAEPSQDRWAALKGHARNLSESTGDAHSSPRHSPVKSLGEQKSLEPIMGTSGVPAANDPLPEIGHFDSKSDITEPSVVRGPLGGDTTGKSTWPYTPEPQESGKRQLDEPMEMGDGFSKEKGLLAAAAGGAGALAAAHALKQSGNKPDRNRAAPSPAAFRDEGYVTDNHGRSTEVITPHIDEHRYSPDDIAEYERAMDAQDLDDEDPFTGTSKHSRHLSGNSHGMASPLYDSATGKGLDRIESKDIVALMDHLTVRDAQRNARDTEILVTLVRSAAEMRTSFDEMRRFICEQDRLIMQNTDRDAEQTIQKVLGGSRAQSAGQSRTPRGASDEEVQTKRKNVLRRALKGLTGGKKADDLAKVEDMLMQILDNVEDLKHVGLGARVTRSYTNDSLDSYEKLRAGPDSGYEPDGEAGTASNPNTSGHLSLTPRGEKQQFHSGYDGRRGSINRVSTVAEEDDDDALEPHERMVLNHQFENNERLLTPTQEFQRRGLSPNATPPQQAPTFNITAAEELTPKAAEKQRKHKSNSSSIFGVPKISRWSKTTTSSAAQDLAALESPDFARGNRPLSGASRSGSHLNKYDDDGYELEDDDRVRSTQSLARDQQRRPTSQADSRSMRSEGSRLTRTPSPLIPSESSVRRRHDYDDYDDEPERSPVHENDEEDDFDDPKYQAHRNSLLLQHPQPVQGTTGRHQNTLESQAQGYDPRSPTASEASQRSVSDFDPATWGSSGTAALSRNRFVEPQSPNSNGRRSSQDEDPLVPRKMPDQRPYEPHSPDEQDWEPEYSNSGFSKGGYYSSPYGSGHLLEPIEERYSLEVDGQSDRGVSPISHLPSINERYADASQFSLSPEPQYAKAIDMRSPARKITGPRPMGSKSPDPHHAKLIDTSGGGTVRRKPVGARSQDSLRSVSTR